jgi:hypothetical protein
MQFLTGTERAKPWVNVPGVLLISPDGIQIVTFYFPWERVAILSVLFVVLHFAENAWKKYVGGDDKKSKKKK